MCPGPLSLCRVHTVFFAVVTAVVPLLMPPFSRSSVLFSFVFPLFILAQFMEYDARCDELEATEDYHLSGPKDKRLIPREVSRQECGQFWRLVGETEI
jgi:hypothetical protein